MEKLKDKDFADMVRWWQKNDRVTLSIAKTDPERLAWAKDHPELPWQIATVSDWRRKRKHPLWHLDCAYRIDPAYVVPEEPASPWDEVEVFFSEFSDCALYQFRYGSGDVPFSLDLVLRIPGYEGILWRDDLGDADDTWHFLPQGIDYEGFTTSDPNGWIRPCRPVKVRFRRGA
jgi:hypothetical protein